MDSRILNLETLGAVIAAAPRVWEAPVELATKLVVKMEEAGDWEDLGVEELTLRDGKKCWHCTVLELTKALGDEMLTAHEVGKVLNEMGLSKKRMNDGYHVYWNEEQLELLKGALL